MSVTGIALRNVTFFCNSVRLIVYENHANVR